jgi:CBS domain-containing protein
MTPDPVIFHEDQSLRLAAMLLFHQRISGAPVVTTQGRLVGVLSERDLLDKEAWPRYGTGRKADEADRRRSAVTVGEACTRPARETTPDTPLRTAARQMVDHDVSRLVVVEASRVAGIVTRHDILRALMRADADIQAVVDATLAGLDEPGVRAVVTWGEVEIDGAAKLRSRVARLVRLIEEVDGVMAVYGDLQWEEDDVLPPALVGHPLA